MTKRLGFLSGMLLLGSAVTTMPAMAVGTTGVDLDVPKEKQSGGFVGLGVGYVPDYEGSDDYEAVPAPFGQYRWASGRYINLGGTQGAERAARLSLNVIKSETSHAWTLGPLLQYRLERDDVDNDQVDNMRKVDDAVEAGVFLGLKTGPWSAELAFAGDISDEHDGFLVYLKGGYEYPVNQRFLLEVGGHVTYADSDYMETYFNVDNKNRGTSNLPNYENSDSGIKDAGLNLTGFYQFNETWGMVGAVGWTRMLNDAEDSPLVDGNGGVGDENQFEGVLAVTYSF